MPKRRLWRGPRPKLPSVHPGRGEVCGRGPAWSGRGQKEEEPVKESEGPAVREEAPGECSLGRGRGRMFQGVRTEGGV